MTEAEWLAANDPKPMLARLGGRKNDRKLRLFAVASSCRTPSLHHDEVAQKALIVAELFADGLATKPQRRNAFNSVIRGPYRRQSVSAALSKVASVAAYRSSETAAHAVASIAVQHFAEPEYTLEIYKQAAIRRAEVTKERTAQTALIRDIFGNPFSPATLDPSWLTSTVLALAQGIYSEKAFDRMPILADALQDAGCRLR